MKGILIFFCTFLFITSYGQADFKKYFDNLGLKGSTTVYDLKNNTWIQTDSTDAVAATLPASTFKIPNTLIALEYKAVKNENEILKWDSIPKTHLGHVIDSWNQDTDLKNAFRNSTVWFYVEIAKRIGRAKYRKLLKECHYGNGNYTEKGIDFWNYGDFAITPKNQIEFLIKLYQNKLPFSKKTIEKTKEIMIAEQTDAYTYRGKTGWTRKNDTDIGWWVGYLETKDNVYFFATRILKNSSDDNPDFSKGRKEITRNILNEIIEKQKDNR
ncbi:penicillin-binding transpeptidase domain-containing protein [Flavobacterium amniphilum]|uniref:penicillin-binding transpeptidase domain-containing protein n=1 Tax=Flavobacterium amniphilum TaxID=1834035 RepID=UPI00202A93FE|nr:penicillin-binding transpeptidase domain-containing protein [Flavobacterium amniphilum]MCL9807641.1 penicillin-binding transpeptidase domain-containing protein [Flavobacterium amniphilum]